MGGKYPIRYGGEQISSMRGLAESRFYKDVHRRVQEKVQEPEKVKQRIFVSPPLVQGKKILSFKKYSPVSHSVVFLRTS